MRTTRMAALDSVLAATPGTISLWCGRLWDARPTDACLGDRSSRDASRRDPSRGGPSRGGPSWGGRVNRWRPAYARLPETPHYAASMMKVALLAATYRAHEDGRLDLDAEVPVRDRFHSALPGAPDFRMPPGSGPVWQRLGSRVPLRWLAEQMIVRSDNLASNIVLAHLPPDEADRTWQAVGARHSTIRRGVEDQAARAAGITNEVTAADLAALLAAIARADPHLASPRSCAAMLDTLCAQRLGAAMRDGLPEGTRVAHKDGFVTGVRHAAGIVYPTAAPPYLLVICASTPLALAPGHRAPDGAARLISLITAASWADLGSPG